jgi:hypothetical protein
MPFDRTVTDRSKSLFGLVSRLNFVFADRWPLTAFRPPLDFAFADR